ncbi:CU044_5270 family protein [Nonomuraea sp. LPB2021202275-12-8]|uniref:CU044_5270 family protein n=1 Tax=Nonomuraea sp. LPB2021202275-12-8 TaxID=3120159 RepID=UPI00300CDBF2
MDEMTLLNRRRDEVPLPTDLSAAGNRLLAEIRRTPDARPRRAARPRRRGALVSAFGLAAALAVAATQLGGTAAAPPKSPAKQPTSAAAVLENAALVAEKTEATAIRPDQWFYMKESQPVDSFPVYEHWSRMDGLMQALRESDGKLKVTESEKGPTNSAKTQREVEALPDDPDAMLRHFHELKRNLAALSICEPECPPGSEQDRRAYGAIQWYLKYGPLIPPDTAATMFRAMAKIPSVKIEENVATAEGRLGLAVVLDFGEAGKGYTILDPQTYRYLGVKSVRGDHTMAMSVLDSGIVDKPGDTP